MGESRPLEIAPFQGLTTEMAELMKFVEHVLQATEPRARDTMGFETEV